MSLHMGAGQVIGLVIPALCQTVHRPAAGIADAQHPGGLVKALPRRIVPGTAHDLHVGIGANIGDEGIASRNTEADKGGLQLRVGDVVGGDVAPDVMDRDQGHPKGQGGRLGEVHPHQHRSNEAGGIAHRHGVNVPLGQPGIGKGLVRQSGNGLHVLPGGDLGHYAAIQGVHIHLGGNGVGQHHTAVPDHRCGSLVTGGFKG